MPDRLTKPLPKPQRFRSLASRLVAVGVGQLLLLALTAIVVFIAEGPHEPADPDTKLTPAVVARLESLVDGRGMSPAGSAAESQRGSSDARTALTTALDELREDRIELSLYDENRQLIASNVDPPLAIPQRPPRRRRGPPGSDGPPPGPPSADSPPPSADGRAPSLDTDGRAPSADAVSRAPSTDAVSRPPSADAVSRPPSADAVSRTSSADDRPRDPGPGGPFADGPGPGPGFGPDGPPRRFGPRGRMVLPFHPHGTRGLLVARGVHGDPPGLTGPVLVLLGGFAILVIGALITARWIVRPIERLSRTARALGSGDLRARSRLDRADEIGELGHRFDEMADRVAGLLFTEKELLANVAHELRTPLTRIGVALDLANEGDAEAARASLIEIAVDVSELETIVDDILTAMRFEISPGRGPAQLPLRRAIVPPQDIAAAAAERLRVRHPDRPLEVTCDDALPTIHVDPALLRRVIDNLLENAHKYTPDRDSPIALVVAHRGSTVVFEVRDHGVGISPEDQPRIFTAFFRGERSRSRETGGVGLGLTLAKRIVEAHDGTIDVTSAVNAGTTIRVTIPT